MKKYPILASKSSSSLLPTNHQIQNPSSTSSSTLLLSSTASFRKYNCGETSSPSSSSCSKRQISDNYLSSSDELRMIDDRPVIKQVGSLFDQSMHTKSSVEMCRQKSELHLTRCHGVKSLGTTKNNTVTSHSLPSDRQLKKVVNKVFMIQFDGVNMFYWNGWLLTVLFLIVFDEICRTTSNNTYPTGGGNVGMKLGCAFDKSVKSNQKRHVRQAPLQWRWTLITHYLRG